MFTGIIEEIGQIISYNRLLNGVELKIKCSDILTDAKIGDSICVNGVCQTVTDFTQTDFITMLSNETLNVTTFSDAKIGDYVNLERALTINTKLGGHIVLGHIDTTAEIINIERLTDFYNIKLRVKEDIAKYIVYKGSVTINGISLTVSSIKDNIFSVAIIPHTYQNTTLKFLKIGNNVNIETDIFAKYVEKLLRFKDNNTRESSISINLLKENGFI